MENGLPSVGLTGIHCYGSFDTPQFFPEIRILSRLHVIHPIFVLIFYCYPYNMFYRNLIGHGIFDIIISVGRQEMLISNHSYLRITLGFFVLLGLTVPTPPQELQHETMTVNIEVPVRVFQGETFIDNLSIADFELFEDGIRQKLDAVYLIKKNNIAREELKPLEKKTPTTLTPQLARHFVLVFEVIDYLPKLKEAVCYFFQTVYMPGDSLTVITPGKTYHIKDQALSRLPKAEIIRQLDRILLRDIKRTGREIKSLIRDIEKLYTKTGVFAMEHGDHTLQMRECLEQIEALRTMSEERLLNFSDFLKNKDGQKNVFLFYQHEMVPRLGPYMDGMRTSEIGTDVPFKVFQYLELGGWYRQGVFFDVNKVKQIFSDSSIHIHFLYLTRHPIHSADVSRMKPLSADGVRYEELPENFFDALKKYPLLPEDIWPARIMLLRFLKKRWKHLKIIICYTILLRITRKTANSATCV